MKPRVLYIKRAATALFLALSLLFSLTSCNRAKQDLVILTENLYEGAAAMKPTDDGTILRVVTFNTKVCNHGKNIAEAAEEIRAQEPDIVFLQEIDNAVKRSGNQNVLKRLATLLEMNYSFFPAISLHNGTYGLGLLSRFPIENPERMALESGKEEQRILAKARVNINGTNIELFNTHLSYESEALRVAQFHAVNTEVAKSTLFLLAGDFNVKNFAEYSLLHNVTAVNAPETQYSTFNAASDGSFACIDNIFAPISLRLLNARMVESKVSDHNLLVANWLLPAAANNVSRETSTQTTVESTQ